MSPDQLKLVIDSIIWAFRHTERNIAETGWLLIIDDTDNNKNNNDNEKKDNIIIIVVIIIKINGLSSS